MGIHTILKWRKTKLSKSSKRAEGILKDKNWAIKYLQEKAGFSKVYTSLKTFSNSKEHLELM
jgi:hypothetical protein